MSTCRIFGARRVGRPTPGPRAGNRQRLREARRRRTSSVRRGSSGTARNTRFIDSGLGKPER